MQCTSGYAYQPRACRAYRAPWLVLAPQAFADLKFEVQLLEIRRQTSCLGAGRHGGVQKDTHVYSELANQLLGRAPPPSEADAVEHRLPDERHPMPLTSEMPA